MDKLASPMRASEVALRLGESTRRMADAFGAAGLAIALIGRDGRVVHMNARFERCVGDGVRIKGNHLGSWKAEADRALAVALGRAVRHEGRKLQPLAPVVLPRKSGHRPLVARVIPVASRAQDSFRQVAALVTLTDLEAAYANPASAVLEQAFDLTPSEARLAAQIAAGKSLPEVSQAEGNARETLRSRLKAIFAKTGTRRQTELALLLSKLAPP